jgi:hypothetical protein
MEPTGKGYVASGSWDLFDKQIHWECAEGAIRSILPKLPEAIIPFDGVFRKAA